MAKKSIIWSERANHELKNILEFYNWRNGNPNYSLKILEQTEKSIELIGENEKIGKLTSNKITRALIFSDFLLFYEIGIHQIEIVSFWDAKQDPKNRIDL